MKWNKSVTLMAVIYKNPASNRNEYQEYFLGVKAADA
jgi:hypothetical protein